MKLRAIGKWGIIVILGVVLAYVWYGFLFPDPFALSHGLKRKILFLWLPRVSIPIVYGLIVLLILHKKKESKQNLLLLLLVILIIPILAYPIVDISYYKIEKNRINTVKADYHSFLQLKPGNQECREDLSGEGTYRIFCLGGSTTEFKGNDGIGWPKKLEAELRKYYETDSIVVCNFGRQWYTTLHSLINFETNLRKYKPDLIICMHNINDLLNNADFSYFSNGPFRQDYGHFNGPSAELFRRYGLFGTSWNSLKSMWNHKPRVSFTQDSFPGLESFTRNLNTLMDLASQDNTKVILLSQPNIYTADLSEEIKEVCEMINSEAIGESKQWDHQTGYLGMTQYNKRVEEISKEREVYFIDLERVIPKSLTYFFDEVHYQDTTFSIISNFLCEEIADLEIIPE